MGVRLSMAGFGGEDKMWKPAGGPAGLCRYNQDLWNGRMVRIMRRKEESYRMVRMVRMKGRKTRFIG
jgi:hypothetical protein